MNSAQTKPAPDRNTGKSGISPRLAHGDPCRLSPLSLDVESQWVVKDRDRGGGKGFPNRRRRAERLLHVKHEYDRPVYSEEFLWEVANSMPAWQVRDLTVISLVVSQWSFW